jgi:hypothetical protein
MTPEWPLARLSEKALVRALCLTPGARGRLAPLGLFSLKAPVPKRGRAQRVKKLASAVYAEFRIAKKKQPNESNEIH